MLTIYKRLSLKKTTKQHPPLSPPPLTPPSHPPLSPPPLTPPSHPPLSPPPLTPPSHPPPHPPLSPPPLTPPLTPPLSPPPLTLTFSSLLMDVTDLFYCEPDAEEWDALRAKGKLELRDFGGTDLSTADLRCVPECIIKSLAEAAHGTIARVCGVAIRRRRHVKVKTLKPLLQRDVLAVAEKLLSDINAKRDMLLQSTYMVQSSGDVIVRENESCFFSVLLSGTVLLTGAEAESRTVEAPAVVVPLRTLLTKKKSPYTIACTNAATLIDIPIDLLPSQATGWNVMNFVEELGLIQFTLRRLPVLSDLGKSELELIGNVLQQEEVQRGQQLCQIGEHLKTFKIVLRGEVVTEAAVETASVTDFTELPRAVAEREFFFLEPCPYTLRVASETATVLTISRRDLMRALGKSGAEVVLDNCVTRRVDTCLRLAQLNGGAFEKRYLAGVPEKLVDLLGVQFLVEVLRSMTLSVAKPREPLLSTFAVCDKLLMVTEGTASFTRNDKLVPFPKFEVLGWTCMAQHRWMYPFAAVTFCDVWELDRIRFFEMLKAHKLLRSYLLWMDNVIKTPVDRSNNTPIVIHPTPDLQDFKSRIVMRLPQMQKNWTEWQAPKKTPPKSEPVVEEVKPKIGTPQERLQALLGRLEKPVVRKVEKVLEPAKSDLTLKRRTNIRKVDYRIATTEDNRRLSRIIADDASIEEVSEGSDEGERESVFSETEQWRRQLAVFLASTLPERIIPMPPPPVKKAVTEHHPVPRTRHLRPGRQIPQMVASPVLARGESPTTFDSVLPESKNKRLHPKRADIVGAYRGGVFTWHFITPEAAGEAHRVSQKTSLAKRNTCFQPVRPSIDPSLEESGIDMVSTKSCEFQFEAPKKRKRDVTDKMPSPLRKSWNVLSETARKEGFLSACSEF